MTIPAHYLPTVDAAAKYGSCVKNFLRMMPRYGYAPVVEYVGGPHGGSIRRYWWNPTDVLMARREARQRKVVSDTKNIARYNDLPENIRTALVRDRRMERLRKYYQAKAQSRAAA
jgi:hypothetical protein